MTKNHGLNMVILFVWMMLTCGGLGNAAFKYDGIYWVPFIVNALIFIILCVRESKSMGADTEAKEDTVPSAKLRDSKTGRFVKSSGGTAK